MSERITSEERAWRDGYEAGVRAARDLTLSRVLELPVLTIRHPADVTTTWYSTYQVAQIVGGDA